MGNISKSRLHIHLPKEWSDQKKGDFFEEFVATLLKPMNFDVVKRIRFTGIEIDLLAKDRNSPRKILVECKAHETNISADAITKMLGNRRLRKADSAWLFTTSDLTKDGKGAWEEIKNDQELSREFTWYSPEEIIGLLVRQNSIKSADYILAKLEAQSIGEINLIVSPGKNIWVAVLIDDGIPKYITAFDANSGLSFSKEKAYKYLNATTFSFVNLKYLELTKAKNSHRIPYNSENKSSVARVISGDSWEDPRPADMFFRNVQKGTTKTRVFSIEGPSGLGKSSLILKLADIVNKRRKANYSLTAIDTRSATNSSFVCEALRAAFLDAKKRGFIENRNSLFGEDNQLIIESHVAPLESKDIKSALQEIKNKNTIIILIFDQFEEMFGKEELFDAFHHIRNLCFAIDAEQAPIIVAFAWKTDISHPQGHPAYHLWHELKDRRKIFLIREFGTGDIKRVIHRAEEAFGSKLTKAIKSRLIEQCQGLPWLLKKLAVHIITRLPNVDSQYELLERELDIKVLFKDDLSRLNPDQIKCLKYIGENSPASITSVEKFASSSITNSLIHEHLIIRTGMNYVLYWDIFQDYLVENKVPHIPWARTFQRGPTPVINLLRKMDAEKGASLGELAQLSGVTEATCQNVLTDLFALQLIDGSGQGIYYVSSHVDLSDNLQIANLVMTQLRRHIVYKGLVSNYKPETPFTYDDWFKLFSKFQTGISNYSRETIRQYANSLRRWLEYSGLLVHQGRFLARPLREGETAGNLGSIKSKRRVFLAATGPKKLMELVKKINQGQTSMSFLMNGGLRNAIYDANALQVIKKDINRNLQLNLDTQSSREIEDLIKERVLRQKSIRIIADCQHLEIHSIAEQLMKRFDKEWTESSQKRIVNALKVYYRWANS
jgi:Holliday junction resolvase-like predicted endonuclease